MQTLSMICDVEYRSGRTQNTAKNMHLALVDALAI